MKYYLAFIFVLSFVVGCAQPIYSSPASDGFCDMSSSSHQPAFESVGKGRLENIQFCPTLPINYDNTSLNVCTYSTFGKKDGSKPYSTHFAPNSQLFLSWLGIQIVPKDEIKREITTEVVKALITEIAAYDYKQWLYHMMNFTNCSRTTGGSMKLCAEPLLTEAKLVCASDKNDPDCKGQEWTYDQVYRTFADVGDQNPDPGKSKLLTVPKSAWKGKIKSYSREVEVHAFYRIWRDECGNLVFVYATCTKYDDLSGKVKNKCTEGKLAEIQTLIKKENVKMEAMKWFGLQCKKVECGTSVM